MSGLHRSVTTSAQTQPTPRKYLLWDTSALVGYYVPEAATGARSLGRAQVIIEAGRHHHLPHFQYIPNIVVAEVFTQLAKLHYSTWDPTVHKKFGGKGKSLHGARYKSARRKFRADIHNGALLYQYDLNRYHILALDLIAPVDKHRQFYRRPGVQSMGAADLLVGAMAMHLARLHGRDAVALLTCDRRMDAILANACRKTNANTAKDLGLHETAKELGFYHWNPDIYPQVIDLERAPEKELVAFFDKWPLNTNKVRGIRPRA